MACGCNNRHSAVQSANINNRSPWCDSCGCNRGFVGGVNTGNSNSCGCGNGSVGGTNTGNGCGCNRNSVGGANTGNSCGCGCGSVGGANTGNNSCGCGSVGGTNTGNNCGCGNGSVGGANTGNSCRCNRNRRPCGLINGVSCGVTQAAFGIARGVDTILDSIFCCGGR